MLSQSRVLYWELMAAKGDTGLQERPEPQVRPEHDGASEVLRELRAHG